MWGQKIWAKGALTLMPPYCDLNAPVPGALRSFCALKFREFTKDTQNGLDEKPLEVSLLSK